MCGKMKEARASWGEARIIVKVGQSKEGTHISASQPRGFVSIRARQQLGELRSDTCHER